jgi:hypothetical protein
VLRESYHDKSRTGWLRTIRALCLIVILVAPSILLVIGIGLVRAQLPAANPLVVPPLPPSPPAMLPAPVSTAVAPTPLAVPSPPEPYTLPMSSATPVPRTFNCSCSGPGLAVHWIGQVTASGYSAADQSASGQCSSYAAGRASPPYGTAGGIGAANGFGSLPGALQNAGAANFFGSPGVASSSGSPTSLGSLPGASQGLGAANSFGSPQTGITYSSAQTSRLCSRCFCD